MKLLEIYLSPIDARRFQAIATQSPGGDGSAESSLPFWDGEVDRRTTLIKLLEVSGGFRAETFPGGGQQEWMVEAGLLASDRNSFHPGYLEKVGQGLYEALFPVGSRLRSTFEFALRSAEQEGVDLHLRLKFAEDSARRSRLADYPWELIHDGQRFLLHRGVVMSRYIAYEALPPALSSQEQLRVLLVSSSAFDTTLGMAKLPDTEQQAVREGLTRAQASGAIALELLPQVTRKGLSIYLTDCDEQTLPQVIHFDGHGLYGKRCVNPGCRQIHWGIKVEYCSRCQQQLPEPEGFLMFEGDRNEPDYVSAREFAALLPSGVALVVLSACQSGMAVAGESLFNGMAQQLIDARVPAVVAMQYEIRVDAASQFAEQFYRVLGKREPLVVAVREGRKWMMVQVNQWYRPVLYLRWQDNEGGQLFGGTSVQTTEVVINMPDPVTTREVGASMNPESSRELPSFQQVKLKALKKRKEVLMKQYEAAYNQLSASLASVDKVIIEEQIGNIQKELQQVEDELNRLLNS